VLETLSRLETASRHIFQCLGLGSVSRVDCLGSAQSRELTVSAQLGLEGQLSRLSSVSRVNCLGLSRWLDSFSLLLAILLI